MVLWFIVIMLCEGIILVMVVLVKIDDGSVLGVFICLKFELILFFELSKKCVEVIIWFLLMRFVVILV